MSDATLQIDRLVREHLTEVLTAAVREYATRAQEGTAPVPVDRDVLTPTDVVIAASDLIRAVDLNLFDVAMWFRRPLPQEVAHG